MTAISLLLGVHIVCGTVSLVSLAVPFLSRWGGRTHRRSGWVFSSAMGGVCLTAWALSAIRLLDGDPGNDADAVFLAQVGLLSGASVWMGIRAARLKQKVDRRRWSDVAWPAALVIASACLFVGGLARGDVLWIVFSAIGAFGGLGPLRYLFARNSEGNEWMVQHLGSMGTGAISAVTAFFVVNAQGWGMGDYALVFWIAPGILGGIALSLLGGRVRKHGLASP
jgi:hypothetical protein